MLRAAGIAVEVDSRPVIREDEAPVVILDDENAATSESVIAPITDREQMVEPALNAASRSADAVSFVEEDRKAETALFQAGAITYTIETRSGCGTQRRVAVRAHGQASQDRIDAGSEAQRRRFAAIHVGLQLPPKGTST